jgi:excisionase family DNA binding protein
MKHSNTLDHHEPEFYSTREAAVKLGLSLGTIQKMVETGTLSAWKTSGGHRRVLASSLLAYMQARQSKSQTPVNQNLSILVVEDDVDMQKLYSLNIADWGIDVDLHIEGNGLSALLHIAKHRPDVMITDLRMPNFDGFDMVNSLRSDHSFSKMDIVVVTGMSREDIAAHGGLPKVFAKPVSFATLQGYVTAKEAAKVRAQ